MNLVSNIVTISGIAIAAFLIGMASTYDAPAATHHHHTVLETIVTEASLTSHHDCAGADVLHNRVTWTSRGNLYTTKYKDMGDRIDWYSPTPKYAQHIVTDNRGQALRLICLH